MASALNITDRAKILIGTDDQVTNAELLSITQTRLEMMYDAWIWSRTVREFTISLIANISSTSSDEVTVTNGDATVTSAGTPFTTSPSMVGYQIQIGAEPHYFFIDSVTSTSVIELGDGEGNAVTWPRATASGSSWRIFQHRYALPSDCNDVLVLSHDKGDLEEVDGGRVEIDFVDPDRSSTHDPPKRWWYDGESTGNVRGIAVWGNPAAARLLRGWYARIAPALSSGTNIDVPLAPLVYGVAADTLSMLFAKTGAEQYARGSSHFNTIAKSSLRDAVLKDRNRWSPPTTFGKRSRTPLARDHSFFPDHMTMGDPF